MSGGERTGGEDLAWFCVRSQPKHEHIAAAHLRREGMQAVLPRIKFKKPTARGPVWVTEVLFPSYVFAQFNWRDSLRLVHYLPGVAKVVSFGNHWPTIPDEAIDELRRAVGQNELHVIPDDVAPGDAVQISGGAFHGLIAVVTHVFPAKQRVRVLLDFLGRQSSVEVNAASLVRQETPGKRMGLR